MKINFETGQLVQSKITKDYGIVREVEPDYHGARQAFKVYGAEKGQAIKPSMANGIGPTKDGIRDRVKVRWIGTAKSGYEMMNKIWHDGKDLEIMGE
jgi:hypothetical protein